MTGPDTPADVRRGTAGGPYGQSMSRLERAEATLAAAHERHPQAVLPGGAHSPMDSTATQSLAHELIADCERTAALDRELAALAAGSAGKAAETGAKHQNRSA